MKLAAKLAVKFSAKQALGRRLTAAEAPGTAAAVIGTAGRNVADAIDAFNG